PHDTTSLFPSTHLTPTATYSLSLHDALPILEPLEGIELMEQRRPVKKFTNLTSGPGKLTKALGITKADYGRTFFEAPLYIVKGQDRKSTRLNSSHVSISYAVFCLKKKKRRIK